MGNYSKLFGAMIGNIIGIALSYAATKGFGECTADGCTVLGFSEFQITSAVLSLFNMAVMYQFPANKPA